MKAQSLRKKILFSLAAVLILLALIFPTIAYAADSWEYRTKITIQDTSGVDRYGVSVVIPISGTGLHNAGFITEAGTDTRFKEGTTERNFCISDDQIILFIPYLAANQSREYYLYTGYSPAVSQFQISTGGGYIVTGDVSELEPGADAELEYSGYINTTYTGDSVEETANDSEIHIYTGSNVRAGQRLDDFPVSIINKVSFCLSKYGAPTGTGYVKVRQVSDDEVLGTIGEINVASLTTSDVWYDFETAPVLNPTEQDIRISFEYNGGSGSAYVDIRRQSTDVADGKFTSYVSSWSDDSDKDAAFKIDYDGGVIFYRQDSVQCFVSDDGEITAETTGDDSSTVVTGTTADGYIYSASTFPTVAAITGGNNTSDDTSHTVNLPSGIEAGDLLIVIFAADDAPTITFPNEGTDWIQLFEDTRTTYAVCTACYRIADGNEGSTITVTTSNAQMTAHTSYRITGYSGVPEVATSSSGYSATPDPPITTPTWGAENTLWLAVTGWTGNDAFSTYPSSYTDGRCDYADHADGAAVASARREYNSASEDPGTFGLGGTAPWVANTIAIKPDLSYTTMQAATSGTMDSSGQTLYIGQTAAPTVYRAYVYFDTSSAVPDGCVITAADLKLDGHTDSSTTDFDIVVTNGQPTYPHDTLEAGDFNKSNYSGDGGSMNTSTFTAVDYNTISLNSTGIGWINRSGTTKLCLRSSRDISITEPSGDEYVIVRSGNDSGDQPKLNIYYAPVSLIATGISSDDMEVKVTIDASDMKLYIDDIEEDSETTSGMEIADSGYDWYYALGAAPCLEYVKHTVSSSIVLLLQPDTMVLSDSIINQHVSESGTADSGSTTTLNDDALTDDDDTWNNYSLAVITTTDGEAPEGEVKTISNFLKGTSGTADSGTTTTLVDSALTQDNDYWNGIILKIITTTDGLAPQGESAEVTDFSAYNDTLTFAAMTAAVDAGDTYTLYSQLTTGAFSDAVEAGDTYEIRCDGVVTWGTNSDLTVTIGDTYSYESTTASVSSDGVADTMYESEQPDKWYGEIDDISSLPFYNSFNEAATNMGMPTQTLYVIMMLGTAAAVGLGVLVFTGSAVMSLGATGFVMAAGVSTTILSGWMVFTFVVIGVGILYLARQH